MADPTHDHDHDHDHSHDHDHHHDQLAVPAPRAQHHHDHDHHGHGHDHDHDVLHGDIGAELNIDELDPANRSLAEALRVSFGVLKLVMIVLAVWFVLSGVFMVEQGSVYVRLHLGTVAGYGTSAVYEPGGPYFAWPQPIDTLERVPTTVQEVSITDSFWYYVEPGAENFRLDDIPVGYNLNPARDGSLITGDHNIVHGKWAVTYKILPKDAAQFVRNVGFARAGDYSLDKNADNYEPGYFAMPVNQRRMYRAAKLIRFVAEQAAVRTVAQMSADDVRRGVDTGTRIMAAMQHELDRLQSGITIDKISAANLAAPLQVREADNKVQQAESEKAQKLEEARKQAAQILIGAAGSAYEELLQAIDAYEAARQRGDAAAAAAADQRITDLLNPETVGGEIATLIGEAVAYRRQIRQTLQAEREQFERLLPGYRANPGIVLDRLWQDTRQAVLASDIETLYIPSDANKSLYIEINRDPAVQKRREQERYRKQLAQERGEETN